MYSLVPGQPDQYSLARKEAFCLQVHQLILRNLAEEDFSVEVLADHLCLSVSQLNRRLKSLHLSTAGQLIRQYRFQRAAELLVRDVATVSEIAYLVGYRYPAHFCRGFKNHFGCTPSTFAGL